MFVDSQGKVLTRKQLILIAANQDGGAHIDPALDEVYASLSRKNSLLWVANVGGEEHPIPKADRAAIRQIAHEVLCTLIPGYSKKPSYNAEAFFGGGMIVKGTKPPPSPRPRKLERNERCPCGSGMKYKKCHEKP